MNTVFVFACLIAAVLAGVLPSNEKQFLKEVHDFCQANPKTYEDENKLRNLPQYIDDHQVGVHMSCMAIKAGLQNANGDLNIPNLRTKLAIVLEQSKVEDIVQKCGKQSGSPGKTANVMWACLVQNNVEYYHKL